MVATVERAGVVREIDADRSEEWDRFVSGAPNGHLLQSWAWGEFKARYGWQPVRLAVVRDGEIGAAAQVFLRSVAGFSLAYVPRGPVVPGSRPDLYLPLLDALHKVARSRHSIFLKVEPNEPRGSAIEVLLRERGFVRSGHTPQPRATLMVNLEGGPEAVLKRMKRKTRYNIRTGERRGVTVRPGRDETDLRRFYELTVATGERAEFPVRSFGYYQSVLEAFRQRGQGELLVAEHEGDVIAAMILFAYGAEGIAMYGVSDSGHWREKPNYIRHWKAMEWCTERGCTRYDLWGVPEGAVDVAPGEDSAEDGEDRGGLWGVYRFKQQFGDIPVRYTGAWDYPYIRPLYLLWSHLRKNREE